jgi:membrane protein YqaA with SNARE-associated domain
LEEVEEQVDLVVATVQIPQMELEQEEAMVVLMVATVTEVVGAVLDYL